MICFHCDEPIVEGEDYIEIPHLPEHGPFEKQPWHAECFTRSIIGGLNHLQGKCSCCGGTEPPDPPDMTLRQAAIAAVEYNRRRWLETC